MVAATLDAGIDAPGMQPRPDAPPPDAPVNMVRLRIHIDGRGDIHVVGVGSCDGGSGNTDCMFDVPKHAPVTLQAAAKNNWRFDRWEEACKDAPTTTCIVTPAIDVDVRARFAMGDDDGDDGDD